MEERLLLHGVDVEPRDVAEWHLEDARLVEAHAADALPTRRDQAAVAARHAAHAVVRETLVELALPGVTGEGLGE